MKRLIRLSNNLKREILAEWKPVDVTDPNFVYIITDVMAAGAQMQINYLNSGWRIVSPYGWKISQKEGNQLIMCYKDTGEIRSYRQDRILEVLVDDSLLMEVEEQQPGKMFEVEDYHAKPEEYEIPILPNEEEILELSEQEPGQEEPYDEALNYMRDNNPSKVWSF